MDRINRLLIIAKENINELKSTARETCQKLKQYIKISKIEKGISSIKSLKEKRGIDRKHI